MIHVRGFARDTPLTGTIYEKGERPPVFDGAPELESKYIFLCDSMYEVSSGGLEQQINGESIQVAFESPTKRGFDGLDGAVNSLKEHIATQFKRIGVSEEVKFDVLTDEEMRNC
jgi:hypothetical protein